MLEKQSVVLNFGQGLDTKTDVNQLQFGKFTALSNSVFDTLGRLTKRNGYAQLPQAIGNVSYITTFQNNLIGLNNGYVQSYSQGLSSFIYKGTYSSVQLSVAPITTSAFGMQAVDAAQSTNGLLCSVYAEVAPPPNVSAGIPVVYKYVISDVATGQVVNGPNFIVSSGGTQRFSSRVFYANNNFLIFNDAQASEVALYLLQYRTISANDPTIVGSVTTVSSAGYFTSVGSYDGQVNNDTLYLSWINGGVAAQTLCATTINSALSRSSIVNLDPGNWTGYEAVGCAVDSTGSTTFFMGAVSSATIMMKFSILNYTDLSQINGNNIVGSGLGHLSKVTISAQHAGGTYFVESAGTYAYGTGPSAAIFNNPTNAVTKFTLDTHGAGGGPSLVSRSIGLGSKSFIVSSTIYFLGTYGSDFQNTYFLMNSTGAVLSKLAYGNGQGYVQQALPSVSIGSSSAIIPYLNREFVTPLSKLTNASSTTSTTGIYGPFGVNAATFDFSGKNIQTLEIGNDLQINGGFLWSYDGYQATENGFFLYPEPVGIKTDGAGSSITTQTYFYQAVYRWSDNRGNVFRSSPSTPVSVTVGSAGTVYVSVPTLRLSYKSFPYNQQATPVSIDLYRWSTGQQIYFKTSSFTQDITVSSTNFVQFADILSDAQIQGNEVLYTNGGVIENIGSPAVTNMTTFDSRLWFIDAEDRNLLWFSKQVIEGTPVELSDLLTMFVAPNIGSQGPTGVMRCLASMDDKLIIFKDSAIYYVNGAGPDNTGANNQYSQPIFVTGAVGCNNQSSIILTPMGLMFQSNKGIWLLKRDLSTEYVGKDVEIYNQIPVTAVIVAPLTNQVRFHLQSGITLMYDYFVGQWGTFSTAATSATIYNGLHTYVNSSSSIFQETPNQYQDGTIPVSMSWTTGWASLGGLEGYKRVYRAYVLGNYISSNSFTIGMAYNYDSTVTQNIIVSPTQNTVEQWQLNFQEQQCQSFQMSFTESNATVGAGLTVSGVSILAGIKKSWAQNISVQNRKG